MPGHARPRSDRSTSISISTRRWRGFADSARRSAPRAESRASADGRAYGSFYPRYKPFIANRTAVRLRGGVLYSFFSCRGYRDPRGRRENRTGGGLCALPSQHLAAGLWAGAGGCDENHGKSGRLLPSFPGCGRSGCGSRASPGWRGAGGGGALVAGASAS